MNGITRIVPYLIVAVLGLLVVRRRLSQRTSTTTQTQRMAPAPAPRASIGVPALLERFLGDTGLVAVREVRTRVRGRVFRIGTLLILAGVAAASLGAVSWWEFTGSAVLSVLCTFGVARLAASIYRRSILRTSHRVTIRELVSGTAG